MYTLNSIKTVSYENFLEKIKTQIITNSNIKQTVGTLLDSPNDSNF